MKDEIKEILRILKARSTRYEYCLKEDISYSDESYRAHLLYDYITNLQEENSKLKKKNGLLRKDIDSFIKDNDKLKLLYDKAITDLVKVTIKLADRYNFLKGE